MANVLFTNVRIIDGSGAPPYSGEVLVQGNRIARVAEGVRAIATAGITVIDAAGATLMPGMIEAHTHFSWNDQPGLDAIQRMPPEEHILWCAAHRQALSRHGLDLVRRRRRRPSRGSTW